jgi:hypothetical protein
LTHGQVWQDVVGEVGCDLGHAPGVTRGADPPALAGEGDQALMTAVVAAGAGEPVCEDAAAEVGAEILLDPRWDAVAQGIGLHGPGEEGLEVVLDDGVERGGGWLARAVDGPRGGPLRPAGGPHGGPEETLRRGRHGGACMGELGVAMDSWGVSLSETRPRDVVASCRGRVMCATL